MKKLSYVILLCFGLASCDFQDSFFPRPEIDIVANKYENGVVSLQLSGKNIDRAEWLISDNNTFVELTGTSVQYQFKSNGFHSVKCKAWHKKRSTEKTEGVEITSVNR